MRRGGLRPAAAAVLAELFGGLRELPMAETSLEVELSGVPAAVANALRRALTDEMPGRALRVPEDGFDVAATTEMFMLPQFVRQRIAHIPLRAQIPESVVADLRLRLDATNSGATPRSVYAGDLTVAGGSMAEPLFNPTFVLCVLQPGARIVINGIYIATGTGRESAEFQVARRAAARPLDLPEHDLAATHDAGGAAADLSGYKVSVLVANPRRHLLTAVLPATSARPAEAHAVLADACDHVRARLRAAVAACAGLAVVRLAEGQAEGLTEATLTLPGETHTLGALLSRLAHELEPGLAFVGYTADAGADVGVVLTVRHTGDAAAVVCAAAARGVAIFGAIQAGLAAAAPS